jgi:hypothetical protein
VMLLVRLVLLPVRTLLATSLLSLQIGYRAGRLVGYRRLSLVATGIGIGLLLAPVPGRELRARLRRQIEGRRVRSDPELGERVRFELSHHPRTWHLPQPAVEVHERRVTLRGRVPDDEARQELVRATSVLPGVLAVDDRIDVAGTP